MKGRQNQGCGVFKFWDISMNFINPVNLDYKISKIKNLNTSINAYPRTNTTILYLIQILRFYFFSLLVG